jgi:tetratricopeptide (TPR) repeat protein
MGFSLSAQQRTVEAIESFARSTSSQSLDCNVHQEFAILLENRGRFREAIPLMERVIRESPDWPNSYRCYAACMRRSGGDIDKAIRIARGGLRVNPVDWQLHEEIGRLELLRGDAASALMQFEYAVRFNHSSVPSLIAKALIQATSKDPLLRNGAESLKAAESACHGATQSEVFYSFHAIAAAAAETSDFPRAIEITEQLILRARDAKVSGLVTQLENHFE